MDTLSLVITLPKIGNLQQCQNYRMISLISHPNQVMLKTILNRLNPQADKVIAEEQAGFRAGRSTTEQIFNCTIPTPLHPETLYLFFYIHQHHTYSASNRTLPVSASKNTSPSPLHPTALGLPFYIEQLSFSTSYSTRPALLRLTAVLLLYILQH